MTIFSRLLRNPLLFIFPAGLAIITILLFYIAALHLSVVYIQLTGLDVGIYSELIFSSLPLVKPKRLTKVEQSEFNLSEDLTNILVGLILGDLYIHKQRVNARLCFKQSIIHKDYLEHLYELFTNYCSSAPVITNRGPDKRTGNVYNSIYFYSYSLPCLNEFHNLFYVDGKKVVPTNIADLLTPSGLCYWICDDGYWQKNGVCLCTNSFTLDEVKLLVKVLTEKLDLKCTIFGGNSEGHRIRISSKSVPHLRSLIASKMPPSMQYKIFGPEGPNRSSDLLRGKS